jgi:hypothetical protein
VLEVEPANLLACVLLATTNLCAGRCEEALAAFERMAADVPGDSIGFLGVVHAHACAGRTREARDAFAARDMNLVCLAVDPSFDGLRDDARWTGALARYGLPVIDPRTSSG